MGGGEGAESASAAEVEGGETGVPKASSVAFDAWLQELQREDDDDLMADLELEAITGMDARSSRGHSKGKGPAASLAALRPEDAPMQLDGEHWTVVDMRSSRFERLRKRNQLSAEEQLEYMRCLAAAQASHKDANGPAAAAAEPHQQHPAHSASEALATAKRLLASDDEWSASEGEEGTGNEGSEGREGSAGLQQGSSGQKKSPAGALSVGKREKRRRRRAEKDEVTEEENMALDGSYWQIDPREARTRRRYKRKAAELPNDDLVLVGSGNYGERKRRAQEKMQELKLRQTLKLARHQLYHFGDYYRDLAVLLPGPVPQFLRVYRRRWKRSPQTFVTRVRKGGHHFSFVPEHDKKRKLEERDAVGLRCLLQALREGSRQGGSKGAVTGSSAWNYFESQDEIFGGSLEEELALDGEEELSLELQLLPDSDDEVVEVLRGRGRAPPQKKRKTGGMASVAVAVPGGKAATASSAREQPRAPVTLSRDDAIRRHLQKGRSFLESARLVGVYGASAAEPAPPPSKAKKRKRTASAERPAKPSAAPVQPSAKRIRRSSSREKVASSVPAGGGSGRRKQVAPVKRVAGAGRSALSSVYDLAHPVVARPSTMSAADYAKTLKGSNTAVAAAAAVALPTQKQRANGALAICDLTGDVEETREREAATAIDGYDEDIEMFDAGADLCGAAVELPPPKAHVPHRWAFPATVFFSIASVAELQQQPPPPDEGAPLMSESAVRGRVAALCPDDDPLDPQVLAQRMRQLEADLLAGCQQSAGFQWGAVGGLLARQLCVQRFPQYASPLADICDQALGAAAGERLEALHAAPAFLNAVTLRSGLLGLLAAIGEQCSALLGRVAGALLEEQAQLLVRHRWLFASSFVPSKSGGSHSNGVFLLCYALGSHWPGGPAAFWQAFNDMTAVWTTTDDVLKPSVSLAQAVTTAAPELELTESQLMVDLAAAHAGPVTSDSSDTVLAQGGREDAAEVAWSLLFHFTPLVGKEHSNWPLVGRLLASMEGTRLLTAASVPARFAGDESALLAADGSPRDWLHDTSDARAVAEVLRRLVGLTSVWSTAGSPADARILARVVGLLVGHFRVLRFNDSSHSFPAFLSTGPTAADRLERPGGQDLPFVLLLKLLQNHLLHTTAPASCFSTRGQQQQQVLRLASSLFVSVVPPKPHVISDWGAPGRAPGQQAASGATRSNVRNCMSLLLAFAGHCSSASLPHILSRISDIVDFAKSEVRARTIVVEGLYLALFALYRRLAPLSSAPDAGGRPDLDARVAAVMAAIEAKRATLLAEHRALLAAGKPAAVRAPVERLLQLELGMAMAIAAERQAAAAAVAQQLAAALAGDQAPPPALLPLPAAPLLLRNLLLHVLAQQWRAAMPVGLRCKALQALLTLLREEPLPPLPAAEQAPETEAAEGGDEWDLDFLVSDEELLVLERRHAAEKLRAAFVEELAARAKALAARAEPLAAALMQVLEGANAAADACAPVSGVLELQRQQAVVLACCCLGRLAASRLLQPQPRDSLGSWEYYVGRFGARSRWTAAGNSRTGRQVPLRLFTAVLSRLHTLRELMPSARPRPPPEEALLAVWLLAMCERRLSVQHRFTRALLQLAGPACPLLAACFPPARSPERARVLEWAADEGAFFAARSRLLGLFVRRAAAAATGPLAEPLRRIVEAAPTYMLAAVQRGAAAAAAGLEQRAHAEHARLCFRLAATMCEHLPQLLYRPGRAGNALPALAEGFFLADGMDRRLQASYLRQLLAALAQLHRGGDRYLLRLEGRLLAHWMAGGAGGGDVRHMTPLVSALVAVATPAAYRAHWLRAVVGPELAAGRLPVMHLRCAALLLHNAVRLPSFRADAVLLLPATAVALQAAKAAGNDGTETALQSLQLWYNLFVDGRRHDLFGEELPRREQQHQDCARMRGLAAMLAATLAGETLALAGRPPAVANEQLARERVALAGLGLEVPTTTAVRQWTGTLSPTVQGGVASKALACLAALALVGAHGLRLVLTLLPMLQRELPLARGKQAGEAVLRHYKKFLGELGRPGAIYLLALARRPAAGAQEHFLGL